MVCGSDTHGGNEQKGCGNKFDWKLECNAECGDRCRVSHAKPYIAESGKVKLPKLLSEPGELEQLHRHMWAPDDPKRCSECTVAIEGLLFECVHCVDYRLCLDCDQTKQHHKEHVFRISDGSPTKGIDGRDRPTQQARRQERSSKSKKKAQHRRQERSACKLCCGTKHKQDAGPIQRPLGHLSNGDKSSNDAKVKLAVAQEPPPPLPLSSSDDDSSGDGVQIMMSVERGRIAEATTLVAQTAEFSGYELALRIQQEEERMQAERLRNFDMAKRMAEHDD